jgi:hypothetical protein
MAAPPPLNPRDTPPVTSALTSAETATVDTVSLGTSRFVRRPTVRLPMARQWHASTLAVMEIPRLASSPARDQGVYV